MDVQNLKEQAAKAAEDIKGRAETAYRVSRDAVEDAVDAASAHYQKAVIQISGTWESLKLLGISVALVTAPVPTLIGLAVLALMAEEMDAQKNKVDRLKQSAKQKRELYRVVSLLKKYGAIPQTAVVETDLVRLQMDIKTGTIDGSVLKGSFKDRAFSTLSVEDLNGLAESAPDDDTRAVLEAYLAIRAKSTDGSDSKEANN